MIKTANTEAAKISQKPQKGETANAKTSKESAKVAKEETAKGSKSATAKSTRETAKTAEKEETKETPKSHKPQKPHIRKRGKKYKEISKLIDKEKFYSPEEAIELTLKTGTTKFDSSTEVHVRLGIKTEQSDQNIRTVADLPQGTGKLIKVAAIISAGKEKEAKEAGADITGSDDLISKIEKGFLDFDVVIATPDMMPKIGKLGKILGTKGLMPNPKTETVTDNPGRVIKLLKKGRVELKNDSFGIIHSSFGKVSFGKDRLKENLGSFFETLNKARPQSAKGQFIKTVNISTTMGPSVKIDINKLSDLAKTNEGFYKKNR